MWGALSDKIGTRPVATLSFVVMGIALALYTTGKAFFPDTIFLRLFFAVGASATVSMMTAILAEVSDFDPWMSSPRRRLSSLDDTHSDLDHGNDHHYSPLIQPEPPLLLTERRNGKLVGLVGIFSGLGALAAVSFLLPLPTWIDKDDPVQALRSSYYIVGSLAIFVSILMLVGLHKDKTKSMGWIIGRPKSISVFDQAALNLMGQPQQTYLQLIKQGFTIASEDRQITLGYIGGFVARSAPIATTLFIPLSVKSLGVEGHDAYILAAILSGVANLFALIFAPLWGYLSDSVGRCPTLIISSMCGLVGAAGFGSIGNPRSPVAYIMAAFLGAGQIGAIVTSMSLCTDLKRTYSGSIAGVYSFFGGLGVLTVTLIGGYLTDYHTGFPFYLLGGFYLVLCTAAIWTVRGGRVLSL